MNGETLDHGLTRTGLHPGQCLLQPGKPPIRGIGDRLLAQAQQFAYLPLRLALKKQPPDLPLSRGKQGKGGFRVDVGQPVAVITRKDPEGPRKDPGRGLYLIHRLTPSLIF